MATTEELLSQILTEFKNFKVAENKPLESKPFDTEAYGKFTISELAAMSKRREAAERLTGFFGSEHSKQTVKELTTGSSNIALPTMVQAQAMLSLTNWADMREVCMRVPVPKGSGKTVTTQIITSSGFREWTEGNALAAADPALTSRSFTLKAFGDNTAITDLLANTSAINFVENFGQIHGDAVRSGIFQYVTVQLSAGAGGTISAASGSVLQFSDVVNAIKKVAGYGFQPDYIVTSPSNAWTAFTTSYAVTQFTGALADMLRAGVGKKPNALGLDWYVDPFWDTVFPAGQKKLAYVGCKGRSSIWGALQDDPLVEIYRVPTELQNYVITHIDGAAVYGIANSICSITYAS